MRVLLCNLVLLLPTCTAFCPSHMRQLPVRRRVSASLHVKHHISMVAPSSSLVPNIEVAARRGMAIRSAARGRTLVASAVTSSLAVQTAISVTMLAVSVAKYLPQIRRILRSRSVLGLAPAAYYGDSLVFCTKSM